MAGVLCVGIATQDYVFGLQSMPDRAEKYRARDLAVVGGGIAANAAVAVARLGGRAMIATRLGEDSTARDIVAGLEAEGIDCTLARRHPGLRSSLSAVLVDSAGERIVINHADEMPADPSWLPDRLPAGIGAVMADTRWEEGGLALFEAARASGGVGVLDVDRAPRLPGLVAAATHVAWAAQALREATGQDDPRAGLAAVAAGASNWMAVTDGGNGVWFTHEGGIAHEAAFPIVPVDTLGAGDVFHGALALALAEGQGERRAVVFAAAAAALKCTRFGGRAGTPRRAEVEDFITRTPRETA